MTNTQLCNNPEREIKPIREHLIKQLHDRIIHIEKSALRHNDQNQIQNPTAIARDIRILIEKAVQSEHENPL